MLLATPINTPLQRGDRGRKGSLTALAVCRKGPKTAKAVREFRSRWITPLKRGVNQTHTGANILLGLLGFWGLAGLAVAQGPNFTGIQRLTNQEVLLKFSAPSGLNCRIDAATNPPQWGGLLTLLSTGLNQHVDSAAPFLPQRYYRAEQLSGTNILTGDHLVTTNGDVLIHPINHATAVLRWNGKTIYNDPVGGSTLFAGLPRADLILVSHAHTDHFNSSTIDAVRGSNAVIVVPQAVYSTLSTAQKAIAIALNNGASTNVMGLTIDAVPAYNFATNLTVYHPQGAGNGYVLTIGGKRIYMSGDSEDIPEMRALTNIDVAFVCMNLPFTMTAERAVSAVRDFRPKVVYPYHYRDSSGTTTNAPFFKQKLGTDLGIEVRLRKWY